MTTTFTLLKILSKQTNKQAKKMRGVSLKHQSLTPEILIRAYSVGIFPMSESRNDPSIFWVDPKMRGILPLNDFHISHDVHLCHV